MNNIDFVTIVGLIVFLAWSATIGVAAYQAITKLDVIVGAHSRRIFANVMIVLHIIWGVCLLLWIIHLWLGGVL